MKIDLLSYYLLQLTSNVITGFPVNILCTLYMLESTDTALLKINQEIKKYKFRITVFLNFLDPTFCVVNYYIFIQFTVLKYYLVE